MDKQYSVQFFTSFVEAMQKFCRDYIDFEQCVELSGYLAVEIDNHKKERYVLSEMLQSSGNVISESYCTKAFKTLHKEPSVSERDQENKSPNHYRTGSGHNSVSRNSDNFTQDNQHLLCSAPSRRRPNFVQTNQRMRRAGGLSYRTVPSHVVAERRMSAGQIVARTTDQLSSISRNGIVRPSKRDLSDSSGSRSESHSVKRDKLDLALDDLLKAADKVSETKSDDVAHDNTMLKGGAGLPVGVQVKTESGTDIPYMVIDDPLDADHDLSATDNDNLLDPATSRFEPVTSRFDPAASQASDSVSLHTFGSSTSQTFDTDVSRTFNMATLQTFGSKISRTYDPNTPGSLSYSTHTLFDSEGPGVSSPAGGSQSVMIGVATADTNHSEEPAVGSMQDFWSSTLSDRRMILSQQEEQQFCNLLRSSAAKGKSSQLSKESSVLSSEWHPSTETVARLCGGRPDAAPLHVCDICNKGFHYRHVLERHRQCVHSGRNNFVCCVCASSFNRKDNLVRHLKIHRSLTSD